MLFLNNTYVKEIISIVAFTWIIIQVKVKENTLVLK